MTSKKIISIWRRELVNINKTRDNHLSRLGQHFEHTLLVRQDKEIGEHIAQFGTRVVHIEKSRFGFLGFWFNAISYVRNSHQHEKVDAVVLPIGEEPLALVFRCMWKSNKDTPKIILDLWDVPGLSLEGSDRSPLKKIARKAYLWLLPRLMKKSNIVISGVISDPFLTMGVEPEQIIETENGVNTDLFHPMIKADAIWKQLPSASASTARLLYQGYIHEARGALDMIEVLAKVRALGYDAHLLMVGPSDKDELEKIRRVTDALAVSKFAHIHKEIPSKEIPAVIAGADICLCPLKDIEKYRWSYPVKIYEYMAMGKTVVASDLPGTSHLIAHRRIAGCLYNSECESGLENEIVWLMQNPEQRKSIADAGSDFVRTKSWDNQVSQLAQKISNKL